LISPEQSNVGIIPAGITKRGPIGLVSKSGTLTYQMMYELRDIGFSTAVGIGGDPIIGTTHIDCLRAFQDDPETTAIVMIGEIGGDAEERAAAFISEYVTKPVVGYVAGFTAPEGKTMGHAGAIVSGSSGTAQARDALEAAGVKVGQTPSETAQLMRQILRSLILRCNASFRSRCLMSYVALHFFCFRFHLSHLLLGQLQEVQVAAPPIPFVEQCGFGSAHITFHFN
jgi:succinyl-CoA synthetase alpha subunit